MSAGQINVASSLFVTGADRLALLGKHHKLLMQAYIDGYIDESALSETALRKLIAARILWRPDAEQPMMLRPLVSELIASMVADENRRQINADVAEKLEHIRNRVHAFREAHYKGDYAVAELQMQRLSEQVHDLSGQFEEAIDSLWHRLNSDFGFVATLDEKIRENERAQSQLRRLLDGLELIEFNELIELAEGSGQLRRLLVSQLQYQLSEHHGSLLEVQRRLVDLLARFRQQQSRALLIANMAAFLRQHPRYQPADYAHRSVSPALINIAAPIIPHAAIAIDRVAERQVLAQIATAIPHQRMEQPHPPEMASAQVYPIDEMVAARQKALRVDVESFYLYVIEQGNIVSALDYWQTQQLSWDSEMWLFEVLSEYQALPIADKSLLRVWRKEHQASAHNALMLISDIEVQAV